MGGHHELLPLERITVDRHILTPRFRPCFSGGFGPGAHMAFERLRLVFVVRGG